MSLARLALEHGLQLSTLAAGVGVDTNTLLSVDSHRQPLRHSTAIAIADLLNIELWQVQAEVHSLVLDSASLTPRLLDVFWPLRTGERIVAPNDI